MASDAAFENAVDDVRNKINRGLTNFNAKDPHIQIIMERGKNGDKRAQNFIRATGLEGLIGH